MVSRCANPGKPIEPKWARAAQCGARVHAFVCPLAESSPRIVGSSGPRYVLQAQRSAIETSPRRPPSCIVHGDDGRGRRPRGRTSAACGRGRP